MKDFIDEARVKKEEKERKKREKKEAEAREAEERERQERKAKKKAEKYKKEQELEAQQREELRKDNNIHLAIRMSEMEENFANRVDSVIGPIRELIKQGKKKVTYAATSLRTSYEESDTSVTQELNAQTESLCISEKRKRGPEPVFEDSPPMVLSPKRTPKRGAVKPTKLTGRLTRARTAVKAPGFVKRMSPIKTPLSERLKKATPKRTPGETCTPASKGALQRLRFRDSMMKELKDLDATELQRICKDEGVPYDGKIDAIFAIADNHAKEKFGLDTVDANEVIAVDDNDTCDSPSEPRDE
ncbi:hypothetical protein CBR_g17174 [Chara braunii]|uniref:Uncharacterized protein n=1 Tax=Chara braunii TaxID=69332 RepID=A0A388KUV3_CHABU|nr:hypothetical protein CBR_g17174 [Chara braunii]|eukprot:GBG73836.1 hypothetical protein CBR_g17174 [Chara braunii]